MTDYPRTLLWDIETSPNLGYVWGRYEQNVLSFEQEWHLLTIAWKWLGDKKVQVLGLPDFERYDDDPEDDYDLVAHAHDLFCEADIVIAHNGMQFDTKKAQARMLLLGFDPPSPFKEVDTLKIARKHFAFTSNRLDDLCRTLGIGEKIETGGFSTWLGCLRGDAASWTRMKKYNRHDVVLLEELYLRLRPWASGHPNVATIADRPEACPRCGSEDGMIIRGYAHNSVTRRTKWQCVTCRGYCSGRKTERLDTKYV